MAKCIKTCDTCYLEFDAVCGTQKRCLDCCKCQECWKQLKNASHKFCSMACARKNQYSRMTFESKERVRLGGCVGGSRNKGKPSPTKGKPRFATRGPNNPNWKGGIWKENTLYKLAEYRNWRESIFRRDKFTCQFCGKRGGNIHADHIKPKCLFPELIFDVDNGRTLCVECHKSTPTWGKTVDSYGEARWQQRKT